MQRPIKKTLILGINDIILDMTNTHKILWSPVYGNVQYGVYEKEGFRIDITKTLTSTPRAKRERFSYRGVLNFIWPKTGEYETSTLPVIVRDSYAGMIKANRDLIKSRLKQHFQNSERVQLVDSMRVEM